MNEKTYVGLRKILRQYQDGYSNGFEVTDEIEYKGFVFFEITDWHKFPGEEIEYDESCIPVTLSGRGCRVSFFIDQKQESFIEMIEEELSRDKDFVLTQIDYDKYLEL